MIGAMSKDFPASKPDDSENLEWLRSTAEALWAKGERDDGLMWLERAAKDAESDGKTARATELREAAARLATPPRAPKANVGATTLISDRGAVEPPQKRGVDEVVISGRDVVSDELHADTRKFDYPDGVDPRAVTSAMVPARAALPDDVLPAIRVWITKGPGPPRVIPADGARPSGVVDAMLVSVVPGVDLREALKGS